MAKRNLIVKFVKRGGDLFENKGIKLLCRSRDSVIEDALEDRKIFNEISKLLDRVKGDLKRKIGISIYRFLNKKYI